MNYKHMISTLWLTAVGCFHNRALRQTVSTKTSHNNEYQIFFPDEVMVINYFYLSLAQKHVSA